MINTKDMEMACAEVLEYLKGIKEEDLKKIPNEFIDFLKNNCSKSYFPDFDYNKSLSELYLTDTARYIICYICYNYWCESEKQKEELFNILEQNTKYKRSLNLPQVGFSFHEKDSCSKNLEEITLPVKRCKKKSLWDKIKSVIQQILRKK